MPFWALLEAPKGAQNPNDPPLGQILKGDQIQ